MSLQKYVATWMLEPEILKTHKSRKKIVTTCGCFDLIHAGHIGMFEQCKKHGDILIVMINDDESIRRLKGPGRPIVPFFFRIEVLAAIEYVDFVVSFQEDDPRVCLEAMHAEGIRVDYHVKVGYKMEDIVEASVITDLHQGSVITMEPVAAISTSKIIQRIIEMGGDEK